MVSIATEGNTDAQDLKNRAIVELACSQASAGIG
jgi:hypothetical protein